MDLHSRNSKAAMLTIYRTKRHMTDEELRRRAKYKRLSRKAAAQRSTKWDHRIRHWRDRIRHWGDARDKATSLRFCDGTSEEQQRDHGENHGRFWHIHLQLKYAP